MPAVRHTLANALDLAKTASEEQVRGRESAHQQRDYRAAAEVPAADGTDAAGLNTSFIQQTRPSGWGSGDYSMGGMLRAQDKTKRSFPGSKM